MADSTHDTGTHYVGVGRVAAALGVCAQTVRNLERRGVVPPAARLEPGGRRVWPAADVETIRTRLEQRITEGQRSGRVPAA